MAFLMISKNHLDILVEQLFFNVTSEAGFAKILDLYLNDDESFVVLLAAFPLFMFCLSLKLP